MRAAAAVAPNLAYPPEWRLPATDIKRLARSKCRRRRSGAPPCRRHARGRGRFPVLLPVHARTTGYNLAPQSISEWVDMRRVDGLLAQELYRNGCMGLNSDKFFGSAFQKP